MFYFWKDSHVGGAENIEKDMMENLSIFYLLNFIILRQALEAKRGRGWLHFSLNTWASVGQTTEWPGVLSVKTNDKFTQAIIGCWTLFLPNFLPRKRKKIVCLLALLMKYFCTNSIACLSKSIKIGTDYFDLFVTSGCKHYLHGVPKEELKSLAL